ncbi:Fic family protein [Sulfurospirillum sp. MES]|uniref:Fic/DOC family protein n=1 Tax=Sulfurospirillum sp. MES TaxID=1565314 RepID=UPI0005429FFE|nr:Fic family protein [Sulfurospirillum sp. MES]KHG34043.1 MAG: cell filamentation protein Fic [Sulfurospirillum sp. MES]
MSKYRLDESPIYLEGSEVPKNKLGIKEAELIHEIENNLLLQAYEHFASQITEKTVLNETYFISLHKKTFESLYDFAGLYRTVNMSKGDSQFCLAKHLSSESKRIFTELENDAYLLTCNNKKAFVKQLTYYKSELIALHPFYELNGRTLRLFIDMLCLYNGYDFIDYSEAIENNAYIEASILCVQYADNTKMEEIIENGLRTRL